MMLAFIVLSLLAALWVLWPAYRNQQQPVSAHTNAVKLYQDQMAALDQDLNDGLIDESQAASARLEIQRRILRLDKGAENTTTSETSSPVTITVIFVLFLTGAVIFYQKLGSPNLAASPTQNMAEQIPANAANMSQLDDQLAQVRQRLESEPDSVEGWRLLARINSQLGRYQPSAEAYSQLSRIEPKNADWWILYGEAMIQMANGRVTPAAKHSLQTGLMLMPQHPAGRFYLGQALAQEGNHQAALDVWTDLRDDSTPDAPWMQPLTARIQQTQKTLGIAPDMPQNTAPNNGKSGFSDEEMSMIQGMVSRLKERLTSEGGSLEEWLRLAQSEMVLGNNEGAIKALEGAIPLADEKMQVQMRAEIKKLQSSQNNP